MKSRLMLSVEDCEDPGDDSILAQRRCLGSSSECRKQRASYAKAHAATWFPLPLGPFGPDNACRAHERSKEQEALALSPQIEGGEGVKKSELLHGATGQTIILGGQMAHGERAKGRGWCI